MKLINEAIENILNEFCNNFHYYSTFKLSNEKVLPKAKILSLSDRNSDVR